MVRVGISLLVTRLWALEPAESVRTLDCPGLSAARVAAHLAVEHPEFADGSGPEVVLACRSDEVDIEVRGADSMRRTIEVPASDNPGREREVALAISSLIIAARERADTPPPAPKVVEAAPPISAQRDVASIQLGTSVRSRDLPRRLPMFHGHVRAGAFLGRGLELFGQAQIEYGVAHRERGRVGVLAAAAGPGVAWAYRANQRMGLETWGAVLAGYARLSGQTGRTDVQPGALGAATGEVAAGWGPRLRLRSFVAVLDLQAGYALPTVRGHVTDEHVVRHGGFWAGLGLRVGMLVRRRVDRAQEG